MRKANSMDMIWMTGAFTIIVMKKEMFDPGLEGTNKLVGKNAF